jgi:ferric-dicitrate binding protein FerR (iron transport regulator)
MLRTLLAAAALVVCLTPLAAQDAKAKVLMQVGQVSVLKGGYQSPLSVGQTIQTQQVIITGPNSYAQFQISDGSTFEVFENAKVIFRETPGNWQHLLNVYIGRVKVFIQHLPGVANPNNVTSPTAVISVRGTVFDVLVEDEDGTTFVSVDDGVVDVRNLTAPGNPATLRQGDSIRVIKNQPLLARSVDKGNVFRAVWQAAREAIYVALQQQRAGMPGGGGGGAAPGPTAQGDTGKDGTSPGNPPSAPGNPPAAPGNPPAAPGAPPGPPGG